MDIVWNEKTVRGLMERLAMTPAELGEAAGGWTAQAVQNWLNGTRRPSVRAAKDLTALAQRQGFTLDFSE